MYELGASAFQMSLFYKVYSFVIRNPEATATKMSTLNDSSREVEGYSRKRKMFHIVIVLVKVIKVSCHTLNSIPPFLLRFKISVYLLFFITKTFLVTFRVIYFCYDIYICITFSYLHLR